MVEVKSSKCHCGKCGKEFFVQMFQNMVWEIE